MAAPRTLVLVRHGRTAWNAERRIQGQLDAPLDEVGRQQARDVAPVLAGLRPTRLHASDLSRARVTAETIGAACGLEVRTDRRLRETSLGERQGLTHDEYRATAPEEFARFRQGRWDGVPGAETPEQVRDRMLRALAEVRDGLGPGGLAVVVSHGAAIRFALAGVLGWDLALVTTLHPLSNCGRVHLVEAADGVTSGPDDHPDDPIGDRAAGAWPGWRLAAYDRVVG